MCLKLYEKIKSIRLSIRTCCDDLTCDNAPIDPHRDLIIKETALCANAKRLLIGTCNMSMHFWKIYKSQARTINLYRRYNTYEKV